MQHFLLAQPVYGLSHYQNLSMEHALWLSARKAGRQRKAQGGARCAGTLGTLAKNHPAREGGR